MERHPLARYHGGRILSSHDRLLYLGGYYYTKGKHEHYAMIYRPTYIPTRRIPHVAYKRLGPRPV